MSLRLIGKRKKNEDMHINSFSIHVLLKNNRETGRGAQRPATRHKNVLYPIVNMYPR